MSGYGKGTLWESYRWTDPAGYTPTVGSPALSKDHCLFTTLKGDRIVFLCWQRGERRVAHWHSLSGGFATRRPIQQKNSGT